MQLMEHLTPPSSLSPARSLVSFQARWALLSVCCQTVYPSDIFASSLELFVVATVAAAGKNRTGSKSSLSRPHRRMAYPYATYSLVRLRTLRHHHEKHPVDTGQDKGVDNTTTTTTTRVQVPTLCQLKAVFSWPPGVASFVLMDGTSLMTGLPIPSELGVSLCCRYLGLARTVPDQGLAFGLYDTRHNLLCDLSPTAFLSDYFPSPLHNDHERLALSSSSSSSWTPLPHFVFKTRTLSRRALVRVISFPLEDPMRARLLYLEALELFLTRPTIRHMMSERQVLNLSSLALALDHDLDVTLRHDPREVGPQENAMPLSLDDIVKRSGVLDYLPTCVDPSINYYQHASDRKEKILA